VPWESNASPEICFSRWAWHSPLPPPSRNRILAQPSCPRAPTRAIRPRPRSKPRPSGPPLSKLRCKGHPRNRLLLSKRPFSKPAAPWRPCKKTQINDQAAYERLLNNSGVTLQWLWSAKRGKMNAIDDNDVVRLEGTQANHEGTLKVKGEVVSIGRDSFVLRGTILILDAPDKGRRCERTGDYEFKATGKRKYWRMQQMEACGGLTDYVDIYY